MEEGKVEAFLQETAADAPTPAVCAAVAEFVAEQQRRNRLVVVITSGGTVSEGRQRGVGCVLQCFI